MAQRAGAGKMILVQADVSKEDQVRATFASVIGQLGGLDAVVNNAGIQKPAP